MRYAKVSVGVSASIIVASIILIATLGLNLGIDFTGGSIMDIQVPEASSEELNQVVTAAGFEARVQASEANHYLVRLPQITEEQHQQILLALKERFATLEETRFDVVGPVVGKELQQSSIRAVIVLLVLIGLYVAWAFRKVSFPVASWKYGIITLITAFHDVIVPLGVFAVLGRVIGYQIDTAFVAALLTILGYSINDTIVVFDRTRENLFRSRHEQKAFSEIVNKSIIETIGRSLNTTLTTLLPLFAILIVGGESTRPFVLTLIIGIISGAYSSIFLASPLLVLWERWKR